jgi:hypothetical protein
VRMKYQKRNADHIASDRILGFNAKL